MKEKERKMEKKKAAKATGKKAFRVCYGKRYRRRDGEITLRVRKTTPEDSTYWRTHPYFAKTKSGAWACYTREGLEASLGVDGKPVCEKPMDLVKEYKPAAKPSKSSPRNSKVTPNPQRRDAR